MAIAGNKLAEVGGGQVVVKDGRVIGLVELGIAGLMSTEKANVVARKPNSFRPFQELRLQAQQSQYAIVPAGFGGHSELRISDKGIVDVTKFEFVPVLEKV